MYFCSWYRWQRGSSERMHCLLCSLGGLHCGRDVPQRLLVDAGELPAVGQTLMSCTAMQLIAMRLCQSAAAGAAIKVATKSVVNDLLVHLDVHELVQQPARHLRKGRGKLHVPA